MGADSEIEWTDATWNPVRGCAKVSPGCKHCYAETFAERFRGVAGHPYEAGFTPRVVPGALDLPRRWKKGRRIFVNSMSDLFGEFVSFDFIGAVFGVMAATPRHTYQLLTKRSGRLRRWFEWIDDGVVPPREAVGALAANVCDVDQLAEPWPLPNVHVGVSVEDRRHGLPRIDDLRSVPAALRFVSIEPLLEDLGELDLSGIGWVIVEGESGLGARPMAVEWVRSIREQCTAADVPFFFKQWGGVLKKHRGRVLDGQIWDQRPREVHREERIPAEPQTGASIER